MTTAFKNLAWSVTYIASLSYKKLVSTTRVVPPSSTVPPLTSSLNAFEMFRTRSPTFVPMPRNAVRGGGAAASFWTSSSDAAGASWAGEEAGVARLRVRVRGEGRGAPEGRKKSERERVTWTAGERANMSALGFERRTEVVVTFQAEGEGEGEGGGGVRMREAREVVMASIVRGWALARCCGREREGQFGCFIAAKALREIWRCGYQVSILQAPNGWAPGFPLEQLEIL